MSSSTNYIAQLVTSSISLGASAIIMLMIKRATLTSPYRRLIFGMSFGDVLQSLAMLTGPFAPPQGTMVAPWAVGSIRTCNLNGFIMVFGSTSVPMYLLALSVYYFCKLNLRMTDEVFRAKVEVRAHLFFIFSNLFICIAAGITESFNSIGNGAVCHFARSPLGCGSYPEIYGECTRGLQSFIFIKAVTIGVIGFCFLGIILFMIMLVKYALHTERMFTLNPVYGLPRDQHQSKIRSIGRCFTCFFCWFREQDQHELESDADYVLRLYRRETVVQAILYVVSFLLSYSLTFIFAVLGLMRIIRFPPFLLTLAAFLYPIMGLFNIFIYTRPKVQKFRFSHPEISVFKSFLLVVKAGGEVPDEENDPDALSFSLCCLCMRPKSNQSHTDSETPFSFFSSIFRMRTS